MAIKRASEAGSTWSRTPTGRRVFLAHAIVARLPARYQGESPMDQVSNARRVEMVLEEVALMLRDPDQGARNRVRQVLGLAEE